MHHIIFIMHHYKTKLCVVLYVCFIFVYMDEWIFMCMLVCMYACTYG